MNKKLNFLLLTFLSCACNPGTLVGTLDNRCNPDGTCNNANLVCFKPADLNNHYCVTKDTAAGKSESTVKADTVCANCITKCGSFGLKKCEYTNTDIWWSKSIVCECK